MAARAPFSFDMTLAIGERREGSSILVVVIIGAGIGVLLLSWEAEGFDVSAGETNSNNRLRGVNGLAEELRGQGELAEVLVQRHLCNWGVRWTKTED